jgi:hypothetical protein
MNKKETTVHLRELESTVDTLCGQYVKASPRFLAVGEYADEFYRSLIPSETLENIKAIEQKGWGDLFNGSYSTWIKIRQNDETTAGKRDYSVLLTFSTQQPAHSNTSAMLNMYRTHPRYDAMIEFIESSKAIKKEAALTQEFIRSVLRHNHFGRYKLTLGQLARIWPEIVVFLHDDAQRYIAHMQRKPRLPEEYKWAVGSSAEFEEKQRRAINVLSLGLVAGSDIPEHTCRVM